MKVSVIGSNGFLANAIVKYANSTHNKPYLYGRVCPINLEYSSFYFLDLRNDIENFDYRQLKDSDIVIYAAGCGVQSDQRSNINNIYIINTFVPINISLGLRSIGYEGVFVTFGSYFEVGHSMCRKLDEVVIKESFGTTPNDYVVSKRLLTHFADSYKHQYTHWHFILPTIYGVGENENRLIPYTIKSIIQGKALQFTSGKQIRQYLHVSEVPALLWIAYQKGLPSGIYNIQGPDVLSVKDVVTLIHEKMGKTIPNDCFGAISRDDIDMQYLCLDGELLHKALGYIPKLRLKDVIEEYIESYGK